MAGYDPPLDTSLETMSHRLENKERPTQIAHPWRATLRTLATAALALLPLLPEIARAADIDTVPAVASVLTIAAAIQRVITLPIVDAWLTKYLNLGSQPKDTK